MTERLTCPYCGLELQISLPEMVEGAVQIRCPECESLFSYTPGVGASPLEKDMELHITTGRLGSRMSIGPPPESFRKTRGALSTIIACFCVGVMVMVIMAIVMLTFLFD